MVRPGGVPDEWLAIEPEPGDSVTERVGGAGGGGANERVHFPQFPSRVRRQCREIGSRFRLGLLDLVRRRRGRWHNQVESVGEIAATLAFILFCTSTVFVFDVVRPPASRTVTVTVRDPPCG